MSTGAGDTAVNNTDGNANIRMCPRNLPSVQKYLLDHVNGRSMEEAGSLEARAVAATGKWGMPTGAEGS